MVRLRLPGRRRKNPEGRMAVLDHLRELRRRVVIILLIIAAGAVIGWVFYDPILTILKHPYCTRPGHAPISAELDRLRADLHARRWTVSRPG